ncbi:MAG: hypothetical protein EOM21_19720 [Gammaproteobacteria bacterium]|nr:hypothetical protein [Gammaproteobacteria bacterium]
MDKLIKDMLSLFPHSSEEATKKRKMLVDYKEDRATFDDGTYLESHHDQDCCENHWLDFSTLKGQGAEWAMFPEHLVDMFDVTERDVPNLIKEDWISFVTMKDSRGYVYTLTIYNSNNGYYGTDVTVIMRDKDGHELERLKIQN